jgi:hypothetical protein
MMFSEFSSRSCSAFSKSDGLSLISNSCNKVLPEKVISTGGTLSARVVSIAFLLRKASRFLA